MDADCVLEKPIGVKQPRLPVMNRALVKNPAYAFANTAARINAGIEIIAVLSEHFGVSLPVVVDNAESVTHINSAGIDQLIRLVVSEGDRNLRMEVA